MSKITKVTLTRTTKRGGKVVKRYRKTTKTTTRGVKRVPANNPEIGPVASFAAGLD